jgi:hypothetical protein
MRKTFISGVLGLLALCGTPAWGQPTGSSGAGPAVKKDKEKTDPARAQTPQVPLEELLVAALKDNPDLAVARVKVREAETNLNRARLQVLQKVVALHGQLKALRAQVAEAETRLRRLERLKQQNPGVVAEEDHRLTEATLQKAKSDLAVAEAEMGYLVGQQPRVVKAQAKVNDPLDLRADVRRGEATVHIDAVTLAKAVPRPLAEKIRKAFTEPIKVQLDNVPLKDTLEFLQEKAGGVNLLLSDANLEGVSVQIHLKAPVSLGAVCQLLEDRHELRFIIRDYGVVVVGRDNVPPGAVLLQDLLKADTTGAP